MGRLRSQLVTLFLLTRHDIVLADRWHPTHPARQYVRNVRLGPSNLPVAVKIDTPLTFFGRNNLFIFVGRYPAIETATRVLRRNVNIVPLRIKPIRRLRIPTI